MTFNDLMYLMALATALIGAQLAVLLAIAAILWIKLTPPRAPQTRPPAPVRQTPRFSQAIPQPPPIQAEDAPVIRTGERTT